MVLGREPVSNKPSDRSQEVGTTPSINVRREGCETTTLFRARQYDGTRWSTNRKLRAEEGVLPPLST